MPAAGLIGLGLLILGFTVVSNHHAAGWWVIAAGAGLVIMFGLIFWRLVYGTIVSVGMWLGLLGLYGLARPGVAYHRDAWLLLAAGCVLVLIMIGSLSRRQTGSRGHVHRWSGRLSRQDGVASRRVLWLRASTFALRRKAKVLRPSLGDVSWWQRWVTTPATELGTRIATVGVQGIWSPVEDVTARLGGPRTGKTGEMCGRILDAPGAVIATSTRTDMIEHTSRLRARRGPVYVFNPSGLADLGSSLTFDPLAGCRAPDVATYRAEDLISGGPAGDMNPDREFWMRQGAQALAAMLHAAALADFGMLDVQRWVAAPTDAKELVLRVLRRSPSPAFEAQALQFFDNNDRTRSSITTTILPALAWLTSDVARDAARPGESINVTQLLAERGTLYLLGAEDALTAPLVTALTAHIAREARRIASLQPAGRLDPPLTLVLDEAALICPIPLPKWTSDMGGRNITIHIAAQGRSQLRERYGDTGAGSILNNSATLLVYGGGRDVSDLETYVKLTGERDAEVATHDHSSRGYSTTTRRQQILTEAQFAQLGPGQVVIIGRAMPPAIGRVQMVWNRRDVRGAQRGERRAARATARRDRQLATDQQQPIGVTNLEVLTSTDSQGDQQ
ncbi:MAG: type IV secretory system conjugative DNA transfer family protein [Microlunatus sp.]|nr:type IV secretory system conjugative DNA transfer family protein [Microlunatus sp.]